jgi:abortive infection bacteriophage resistance protein
MRVEDRVRAERKLAQIGYYRLSGFWYPWRKFRLDQNGQPIISPNNKKPERLDDFEDGTPNENGFPRSEFNLPIQKP